MNEQTRKWYLALARRRACSGSGSHIRLLQARTAVYPITDLQTVIKRTPFVVVGGVATRLYMPERMTVDLDILVLAENAPALYSELEQACSTRLGAPSITRSTWRLPDGASLGVIEASESWARQAVVDPNPGPTGLPVIGLPYLVLMKLQAGRVQDLADITRMLGVADEPALAAVRSVVQRYAPDAGEDVESMIVLGRMELGDATSGDSSDE